MLAATPAFAEPGQPDPVLDRDTQTWRDVFVGSVVLTFAGTGLWLFGNTRVEAAEQELCTGSYATNCGHAKPVDLPTVTRYNDQGFQGRTMEEFGVLTSAFAGGVAILAAYEGFVAHREHLAVVPIASPTGGGVSMKLEW